MPNQPEKWWFIEANDVLMFRDSKPFAAGQNFTARSTFPPHPRVMQGVIRTHILELAGADFAGFAAERADAKVHKIVGSPSRFGELVLTGPFVARRTKNGIERLFRAPLDVLQSKDEDQDKDKKGEKQSLIRLKPSRREGYFTNSPFGNGEKWFPLLQERGGAGKEISGWLSEANYLNYLKGEPVTKILKDDDLYHTESRVGLGLDYSRRRGADHQFYQAEFIRPHTDPINDTATGLLVGTANDDNLIKPGPIAIGGEGRTGTIRVATGYAPRDLITAREGRVKVVLLTPAYFTGGYKPASWEKFVGKDAKLVALAIGKPQVISGWDLANKRPRPARHLVPAGSVFYFEGAHLPDLPIPFTESPTAEEAYAQMGFGAIATATWDYLD